MKCLTKNATLLFIAALLLSCATASWSLHDKAMFEEAPHIVKRNNTYYLRFKYGKRSFLAYTKSIVKDDKAIFFLPVTTSTGNPSGRYQEERIDNPEKIEAVQNGHAFWQEPSGELIKLLIIEDEGQLQATHYSIGSH